MGFINNLKGDGIEARLRKAFAWVSFILAMAGIAGLIVTLC